MAIFIKFLLIGFFLVSCAGTPPLKEYSMAREALYYAKKFESERYQPKAYKKSYYLYKEGQRSFDKRLYGQAREFFKESIEKSETSENITRWKKYQKGDYSL